MTDLKNFTLISTERTPGRIDMIIFPDGHPAQGAIANTKTFTKEDFSSLIEQIFGSEDQFLSQITSLDGDGRPLIKRCTLSPDQAAGFGGVPTQ